MEFGEEGPRVPGGKPAEGRQGFNPPQFIGGQEVCFLKTLWLFAVLCG